MIWFFILVSVALAVYVTINRSEHRKQEQLQRGSVDSLLAVIGESNTRQKLARRYFENLERTLSFDDYQTMLRNGCSATDITPELDDKGRIAESTITALAKAYAEYAYDLNTKIRNIK